MIIHPRMRPSRGLKGPLARSGKKDNEPVGILVVNGGHPPDGEGCRWLDLCLNRVTRHTKWPNYRVYIWNNNLADRWVAETVKKIPHTVLFQAPPGEKPRHVHAVPLQKLYDICRKEGARYIVTLDSDAFPIKDDWLKFLVDKIDEETPIAGVWRDELKGTIEPYVHASCLCTSVDFIERHRLRFDYFDYVSPRKMDTLAYFTETAGKNHRKLFKLSRSNVNQLHYLMGGIYGDLVYHQGAGSRKRIFFWGEEKNDALGARNLEISRRLQRLVFGKNQEFIDWLRGKGNGKDDLTLDSSGSQVKKDHRGYEK